MYIMQKYIVMMKLLFSKYVKQFYLSVNFRDFKKNNIYI